MSHEEGELGRALYKPVRSQEELSELEGRVARERVNFIVHAAIWVVVSGFFVVLNAVTTLFEPGDLAGRLWSAFPVLGWGIGVAAHAANALLAAPRALLVQREIFALRSARADAPRRSGQALLDEIRKTAAAVRGHLRSLPEPRIDLEVSLSAAEREAERLASELSRLDGSLSSPASRRAEPSRLVSLAAERDRLAASLERVAVTMSNLEVDALLVQAFPRGHSFATESLETEAALLRAAVEGAEQARATLQGSPSRARERS